MDDCPRKPVGHEPVGRAFRRNLLAVLPKASASAWPEPGNENV